MSSFYLAHLSNYVMAHDHQTFACNKSYKIVKYCDNILIYIEKYTYMSLIHRYTTKKVIQGKTNIPDTCKPRHQQVRYLQTLYINTIYNM